MGQFFEDWSGYNLGDDPTAGADPDWELLVGGGGQTLEVQEDGGVRFLQADAKLTSPTSWRETLALMAVGDVAEAEVFYRFRSTFRNNAVRHVRTGVRVQGSLAGGDGYEVRNNAHRIRRVLGGDDEYLVDERPGPAAENTWYNHLVTIHNDANGDPVLRAKIWEGDPVGDEPAEWLWEHTDIDAAAITGVGKLGPGWQTTAGDAGIHDLAVVGVGWNGDPAPREPLSAEPVILSLPEPISASFGSSVEGEAEPDPEAVTLSLTESIVLDLEMGESLGTLSPVSLQLPSAIEQSLELQSVGMDVPGAPVSLQLPSAIEQSLELQAVSSSTPEPVSLQLPSAIEQSLELQAVSSSTPEPVSLQLPSAIEQTVSLQVVEPDVTGAPVSLQLPSAIEQSLNLESVDPKGPVFLQLPSAIEQSLHLESVDPRTPQAEWVGQQFGALENTPYVFSVVAERADDSPELTLMLYDTDANGSVIQATYNWDTGAFTVGSSAQGTSPDSGFLDLGKGPNAGPMVRLWISATPANPGNGGQVRIYPAGLDTEATGAVILHNAQVSQDTTPQGYVFTTEDPILAGSAGRIEIGEPSQGMIAWRDNNGLARLAIGSTCRVHVYVDGLLSEITPEGFECGIPLADTESGQYGSGIYSAGIYGEGDGSSEELLEAQSWQLDTFGQLLVGMAHSDGTLYRWDLDTGIPMQPIANAPENNLGLVVTPERFLVALGAGGDARSVAWADQQSLTDWTPSSTNQAGDFPLSGQGSLMAGRRGRGETLLWTDKSLWSMQYIGGTLVYSFRELGTECGVISRRAMAVVGGGRAVWMGRRNFFSYDGHVSPLPSEVGDYVFSDLNRFQASLIHAVSLSEFNEVWWFYPSGTSEWVDRYVSFNYVEGTWSFGKVGRTAAVDRGVFPRPLMADRFGVVYDHEFTDRTAVGFHGEELPVFADGGLMELGSGDTRMWVMGYIPDQNTLGSLSARIVLAGYPTEPDQIIGPFDPANPTSIRGSGRQVRLRVDQKEPGWRLGRPRLNVVPAESR